MNATRLAQHPLGVGVPHHWVRATKCSLAAQFGSPSPLQWTPSEAVVRPLRESLLACGAATTSCPNQRESQLQRAATASEALVRAVVASLIALVSTFREVNGSYACRTWSTAGTSADSHVESWDRNV